MKIIRDKNEVVLKALGTLKTGDSYIYRSIPYMKIVAPVEKEDESEDKKPDTECLVVNLENGKCRILPADTKVRIADMSLNIKGN